MREEFSRTAMLIGEPSINILQNSHVAIFGIGGVGSFTLEALVRAGVGSLTIIDADNVAISNINRQIIATLDTINQPKVEVAIKRAKSINKDIKITGLQIFFNEETSTKVDFSSFDYVVDAIDCVKSKILIAEICQEKNIPLIASMGTGNKLDPTKFKVADIKKTSVCPLCRVMRRELKNRGIESLKVVYSEEIPVEPKKEFFLSEDVVVKKQVSPASISFVPSVAGLIIAGEVVRDLI